jgi:hypothetical protein
MARIAALAMLVAVAVLAVAWPSQAEPAGELRVAERTTIVTTKAAGVGTLQVQPVTYRSVQPLDDRDVWLR